MESAAEFLAAVLGRGLDHRDHGAQPGRQPARRGSSWAACTRATASPGMMMAAGADVHRDRRPRHRPERPHAGARAAPPPRPPGQHPQRALAGGAPSRTRGWWSSTASDHIGWYEAVTSCSARSRSSSPARAPCRSPSASSRRCCSPTSSTPRSTAAELGDRRWREVLEGHQRDGPPSAGAVRRPGGEDHRRRVPGDVRRSGAGDPVRPGDPRVVRAARDPDPGRPSHRRVRGHGRRHRRHRRPHRGPRERATRGPARCSSRAR